MNIAHNSLHASTHRSLSRWIGAALVVTSVVVESCGILPLATRSGALEVRSQTLTNGYLIALSSDRKIETVSAFVARDNWLVVTVVDTLLEIPDVKATTPAFADSLEVTRFPSSLQLAFHLTVQVRDVEVVHDEAASAVWISLFAAPRERRRP